uniref:Uncharacterized protein n=1 Tax=viral metagenome TaxID=1070528 RepID=A0A6M3J849_9ZZZZ
MKQEDLKQGTVLLDPPGEKHSVVSIDTTSGSDHSRWRYELKVEWSGRKLKPLLFSAIDGYFELERVEAAKEKPVRKGQRLR